MSKDVIVIVGAGPGIGSSVARQFARSGFAVGLVARNPARLEALAAHLGATTGAEVAAAPADATSPSQLEAAVSHIAAAVGTPTALCFCPIPDVNLIKPVLQTRPEEFATSLALNITGAAAAVDAVVPAMLAGRRGSLLFTTGSAGLNPDQTRAASAVTTTAATTYLSLLRDALDGTGIRVGHTVIEGPVVPAATAGADRDTGGTPHAHNADDVAADLWRHHSGTAPSFPSVLRLTT